MRIKFDDNNRAVIADGYVNGRRVKAVTVCSAEDTYDRNFGEKLVMAKYKYRETLAKIKSHESEIKTANAEIARLMATIENEKRIIEALGVKLSETNDVANAIIAEKYEDK